jgi:hypothetical protein
MFPIWNYYHAPYPINYYRITPGEVSIYQGKPVTIFTAQGQMIQGIPWVYGDSVWVDKYPIEELPQGPAWILDAKEIKWILPL